MFSCLKALSTVVFVLGGEIDNKIVDSFSVPVVNVWNSAVIGKNK